MHNNLTILLQLFERAALLGGFKPTFIIIGLLCIRACLIAVSLKPSQHTA